MNLLNLFRAKSAPAAQSRPQASVGQLFDGLDDPDLLSFMRSGGSTASGAYVSASKALQNMALLRCVTLISESIGMLPLNLIERGDEKKYATGHPIYKLLKSRPNQWQTAYEFKSLMQLRLLLHGNAYARIVRSRGQIMQLIPIDPTLITPRLDDKWNMHYHYARKDGSSVKLAAADIFHLRDLSDDGIVGLSRVKLAREAIGIALQAEKAAARLFKNGVMAGGALSSPDKLSDEAYAKLQASVEAKAGADNAGRWMILEEGLKAEQFANTAADAQHIENRNHQIEEIARAMGVPRPLLMMDDTSWGSGIEQLGIFFVQYSLQHWFTVWEQAADRSLLTPEECDTHFIKFNERALLRGTLKDQAEFFTKALGSGGQQPFMTANEVREILDLAKVGSEHADELGTPLMKDNNVITNTAKN